MDNVRLLAIWKCICVLLLGCGISADVTAEKSDTEQLADLSLEELTNIQITSVSKRPENLSEARASIYVITAEDIRRSGATSLPEVLRLAPNLQVARQDNVQYAITARGFNNAIGNKLLVLIDGRTVYTPLFSGVFWEMQDTMLTDIERIEVISGPGATLWGANAVNGVINVITRQSADTQGHRIIADVGNNERGISMRSGGKLGSQAYFRLYGKYRDWDNLSHADGSDALDAWNRGQVGFRADWNDARQSVTFQGDAFKGESEHRGFAGAIEVPRIEISGINLLARWSKQFAGDSNVRVQAYWSHSERDEIVIFRPESDIFDLEFQHAVSIGKHELLWGGGYRRGWDKVDPGFFATFIPDSRSLSWENIFLQDEIRISEQIRATLGIRLEWNDYTGLEYLPTARLAWKPTENRLLWAAISRAVRAPSRFDRDVFFPGNPPFIVAGGPDFRSEVSHVFEIGYRVQPLPNLSYSMTLFYHDWDKLRSGTPLPLPISLANNIKGEAYGVEAWVTWQPLPSWRLSGGVTTLDKNLKFKTGTSDTVGVRNATLHNDPDYQWTLRSGFDLAGNMELDIYLHGVDALTIQPVPTYTEMDIRLAWSPVKNAELSIIGRNLLHEDHAEFGTAARSEIERSVHLQLDWNF